jgi:hypothetical protein
MTVSHFTIEARDATGARRVEGGDDFRVYVSGPEETRIYGEVADNGDGTYAARYTPPLPGAYAIAIHLEQTPIGNGQPWTVLVREAEPETDPTMCRAFGPGLEGGFTNEKSEFTIVACDSTGTQRGKGGDDFHVYVAGPNETRIFGDVADNGDGSYTATYTPPLPGGYAIAIHLAQTPIGDGKAFELFVNDRAPEVDDDELRRRLNALTPEPKKPTPAPQRAVVVQKPVPKAEPVAQPVKPAAPVRRGSGLNAAQLGPCVVLDNGSGLIKSGIAGEPMPSAVFTTVVGRPMFQHVMPTMGRQGIFVGEEAKRKKGVLTLRYPISHGVVTDWADMEALWTHTFFNELRIDPKERPLLITDQPTATRANREKAAELVFETFGFPGFYFSSHPALALSALGHQTGLVLDAGDGVCHSVPVVNGQPVKHAIGRLDLGGRDCTQFFIKLMTEDSVFLGSTSAERDLAGDIKEAVGFVALDY